MVPKDVYWDFYFLQDQYWFMQRCFLEALCKPVNVEVIDDTFVSGFIRYAKELLPQFKSIFRRAYELYAPYWEERYPKLKEIKSKIEEQWQKCEINVFREISRITKLNWRTENFVVQLVDSLSYNGLVLGDGHYAIGCCDPRTFMHILIHELVHHNILEVVRQVHVELNLTQEQEDAIDETFARLIEMEVTKVATPLAQEPVEQKRKEAKSHGFLEFFDAVLKDWPNYVDRLEKYENIKIFILEEAEKRRKELTLAKAHHSILP
jgi:hypothetical protein